MTPHILVDLAIFGQNKLCNVKILYLICDDRLPIASEKGSTSLSESKGENVSYIHPDGNVSICI